ncbi:MAG: aspartyl protease family protein [Lentimicrobiaceae bacterium]|nr:aspartyl protease family protein [Lentimicrobiaceae bacterium]
MRKYNYSILVIFVFAFFMGVVSFSFAQSKKEIKEAKKQRDKYLFNVKLTDKNVSETIHFKLQKDVVFIPVTINGKTYNFVFDTGAITVFSDSVAKELNSIQSEYSVMVSDAAGIEKKMNFYHTDNVQVGSLQFNNVCYAVENLDIFEKHLCMRTDGLLGTNMMRLLNWEIDFSNQTITVSDKPFLATDYRMEIPFRETFSRNPEIKMEMGEYYFWAILDMGNNDLIQIPDSIFFTHRESSYLKYAKGEGKDTETLFNDETPQNQYVAEIDSFYIGNNLIVKEIVCISPSPMILIGNSFLEQYGKIAINWKQKKIFLGEKNENKVIENDTIWEFVPNLQDNKLIVSFIWENTNLYKEGVRVGDQIVRINGISTEKIDSPQWCEISEEIKNLDNLTVEILKPTGEKITVLHKKTTYKSLIESR